MSYPESYPRQSRAAMGLLGIRWARMSRHRDHPLRKQPHCPPSWRSFGTLDVFLLVLVLDRARDSSLGRGLLAIRLRMNAELVPIRLGKVYAEVARA